MVELSEQQKENIRIYAQQFLTFLETKQGREWQKEREERVAFFKSLLNKKHIDKLTEDEFGRIIESLWASQIWGNKEYLINKLLKDNGLPKIREELKKLLYGMQPLSERFDSFRRNIKGLGPSSITEILTHVFPDKCSMWNVKPKTVLPFLKMKTLLPDKVYKYSITGKEYIKCNQILGLIRNELKDFGFKKPDFMDVDYFLFFIFDEAIPQVPIERKEPEIPTPEIKEIEIRTHTDAQGVLIELGNLLGYDTYVADPSKKYKPRAGEIMGSETVAENLGEISTLKQIPGFTYQETLDIVRNIDVIWFKGEYPEYCFEVEHTTNVRDGLLRLYQISPLKGIKFSIVSPSEVFSKFQREITRRPFKEIKDRYNFRSYEKLAEWFKIAIIYHKLKNSFLGTK